ncbi:capsular biosynthesis protein [Burkholderia ubonensis]|uniref:polysaccharide biosynthesis tyrosine autokinase n=1 Tax=Burkholderia ubonensis TaxID=101571 RepID=UPI000753F656|nr:polysaccharide biosynthesis tyrosine autokinase [Burkholderia ubonensis]KVO82799.1 capsular biosynthesis protein [Burkholderia ubonensis]KVZ58013.1 capsular biosynthesis protein [Burkholderia ubonensis]KVZ61860.1 capsular biosynthesis protein [Burkholderia ubonensis]KWO88038.1 capsular biosynthesis protein [Burkholderia ubonensis]OJB21312.1 capsular biosynthesis protein [Burkholderia ubonensis]
MNHLTFNSTPAQRGGEHGQLSGRGLLRLMRDHWVEIVGIAAFIAALSVIYVLLATPIYSADVLVRVDPPDPNEFGLSSQTRETPPSVPSPDAEMAVMTSRSVLEPVIQRYRFDITVTPRSVPVLGAIAQKLASPGQPAAPWLGLRSFAWGGEQVRVASLEVPRALEEEKLTLVARDNGRYELFGPSGEPLLAGRVGEAASSRGVSMKIAELVARPGTNFEVIRWNGLDAVTRFAKSMKVTDRAKGTGLVEITYLDESPTRAVDVANAISQQYIAYAVAARQRTDSATLDFITKELPRLRAELLRSEQALADYQASAQSMQPTMESQAYLQGGIEFDRQIASLQIQRTQLLERYTPGSRWVTSVDTQIKQLHAAKSAFDARFTSMPVSERRNADLARDAKVAEAVYLGMVQKAEELSVRRASTTGGAHIVDDATVPLHPVKPEKLLIIPGGVALGLFCGVMSVFLRRHVMTGVTDPLYVEQRLNIPVVGEVLFSRHQARLDQEMEPPVRRRRVSGGAALMLQRPSARLHRSGSEQQNAVRGHGLTKVLADRFPTDLAVEGLRGVRTALSRDSAQAPNNVVMFTGPTPAAGKSFVAANLAVLHAEIGSRVLLIDADMRGGHLALNFGQPNRDGLSDVLRCEKEPRDVMREVGGVQGLWFISCGRPAHNSAALLMSRHFKDLLDRFSAEFDLVVIDTPPHPMTDADIIASTAGATVLVLRSGMQSEDEIADTVRKLDRAGARVVGAVFNAIPASRGNRYYDYALRIGSAESFGTAAS